MAWPFKKTTKFDGGEIKWDYEGTNKQIRARLRRRMKMAMNWLKNQVKANISVPTRVYGPSSPNTYLHADTGQLKKSIFARVNEKKKEITGDVGTNLEYGVYWELHDRPFLTRTLRENRKTLQLIIDTGKQQPPAPVSIEGLGPAKSLEDRKADKRRIARVRRKRREKAKGTASKRTRNRRQKRKR